MEREETSRLYDREASRAFYESSYAHDSMALWPDETKRRIRELVRSLGVPAAGDALDYGCGNGVLTEVLREALPPGWRVHGADISATAIENARRRYPRCAFFATADGRLPDGKFDFVFTHHVLEHVYDLERSLDEIGSSLKAVSSMLHILPCGNAGSFEHGVASLRTDGIDRELHNRFVFEDAGHLRRLTTEEFVALCAKRSFVLAKERYANQRWGAVDWITGRESAFIRLMTDASKATSGGARRRLGMLRLGLLGLRALRRPAVVVERRLKKKSRTPRDWILMIGGMPLYAIAKPVDACVKRGALREWDQRQTERNGSEMYLFFTRR
jgi:SAM-dependent methyltransferase